MPRDTVLPQQPLQAALSFQAFLGTALCHPIFLLPDGLEKFEGSSKFWEVPQVTFKSCWGEAVTLPKAEINMNQEDQQWRSDHSCPPKFSDSTNCFAPAVCRGPCCGILAGLETSKRRGEIKMHFSICTPSAGCLHAGLAVVRGLQHGEAGPSSPPSRALCYLQVVLMSWHSFYTKSVLPERIVA